MEMNNKFLAEIMIKAVKEKMNESLTDIKFIGGGSFGKVFKGTMPDGTPIAVKAYRVNGWEMRESEQLRALCNATKVKVPEVLFTKSDENTAIMAMGFIKGQNVLNPAYLLKSKAAKQQFTNDVIDGLLEIHSVKGEKYGDILNPNYTNWLEYFKTEKIETGIKGLTELCEKGKYSWKNLELLKAATEIFYKVAEEPESPVLIHGDINIMNIMADPKTMQLTGFIDPGSIAWADREYDLFQLRNMWGDSFGLYETYKSKWKTSEYCDFKVAYYAALNEACCRLSGGLIVPIWEVLCNRRLREEMKKFK